MPEYSFISIPVSNTAIKKELADVTKADCAECVRQITQALQASNGVKKVKVDIAERKAKIQFDERLIAPDQLKAALELAGFSVEPGNNCGCCC